MSALPARAELGRLLVARVGDERLALPIDAVQEVLDAPAVTPVPLAPVGLAGQCALRGALVPVFEPGPLLGMPRAGASQGVVLVLAGGEVGLWVDDADDLWDGADEWVHAVPAGGDRLGRLRALVRREGRLAAVVETDALRGAMLATLRQVTP